MASVAPIRLVATLVAMGVLCVGGEANAADKRDYRPVSCTSIKPYVGSALRAPIVLPPIPPADERDFDGRVAAALDAALKRAQTFTAAPAITAAVTAPGRGRWTRSIGSDDARLFYWASAGKTMVAAVILQLVDEGRLSLDDPAARWVQGLPNGDVITIRHLLAHTSGLFSANEDLKANAERRGHSLAEDIRIVARHGAMFCPGERWRYSNTGYAVLGAIIEQVDGRSYGDAITARLIRPLGLKTMRVVRADDRNVDVAKLVSIKEEPMDPAWAGAAGPVVASAGDMVLFWEALLGGRVVQPDTVKTMFDTLYPMFDPVTFYGLGVMAFEVGEADGSTTTWVGHAGGAPGAKAIVLYSPADTAFVAVALTGDGSAPATANLLLHQLREK